MKLAEVLIEKQLDEFLPSIGMSTPPTGTSIAKPKPTPQQPASGLKPTYQQPASGLTTGQMDPAQAAQAVKDRQEQKKQIQDTIKQKQQELTDLQRELAQIG